MYDYLHELRNSSETQQFTGEIWRNKMTIKKIRSKIRKLKQSNALLSQAEIIVLMSELSLRGEYV